MPGESGYSTFFTEDILSQQNIAVNRKIFFFVSFSYLKVTEQIQRFYTTGTMTVVYSVGRINGDSYIFYEKELFYSYEEYLKHFQATKDFEKTHPNYRLKIAETQVFRNIQIQIHEGKWVMVSKAKAPVIHFVIRHPKMLEAFENFTVPYMEA